jgi:hypothetical protein
MGQPGRRNNDRHGSLATLKPTLSCRKVRNGYSATSVRRWGMSALGPVSDITTPTAHPATCTGAAVLRSGVQRRDEHPGPGRGSTAPKRQDQTPYFNSLTLGLQRLKSDTTILLLLFTAPRRSLVRRSPAQRLWLSASMCDAAACIQTSTSPMVTTRTSGLVKA